jgi:hypothetical protein
MASTEQDCEAVATFEVTVVLAIWARPVGEEESAVEHV